MWLVEHVEMMAGTVAHIVRPEASMAVALRQFELSLLAGGFGENICRPQQECRVCAAIMGDAVRYRGVYDRVHVCMCRNEGYRQKVVKSRRGGGNARQSVA